MASAQDYDDDYSSSKADANGIRIPAKCRIWTGTGNITYGFDIYLPKGATVKSVKSSNKKLKANIIENSYSVPRTGDGGWKNSDGTWDKYEINGTEDNSTARIGLYTIKPGKYTLTVKIALENKTTVTKKVTVKAIDDWSYTLTYSGHEFDDNGYIKTTAPSGKIKVKAAPDFKIDKIEFANKFDAEGKPVYKTIKNNKKVTLNKNTTKKVTAYNYDSNDGSFYRHVKYGKPITYNYLFAYSVVRISYTDKWTGRVYDVDDANKDGSSSSTQHIYYIK